MKNIFQAKSSQIASIHQYGELFNVEVPLPALQRGWLHGRELTQPWHVERIAAKIGDACWFSHYCRDHRETDADSWISSIATA